MCDRVRRRRNRVGRGCGAGTQRCHLTDIVGVVVVVTAVVNVAIMDVVVVDVAVVDEVVVGAVVVDVVVVGVVCVVVVVVDVGCVVVVVVGVVILVVGPRPSSRNHQCLHQALACFCALARMSLASPVPCTVPPVGHTTLYLFR